MPPRTTRRSGGKKGTAIGKAPRKTAPHFKNKTGKPGRKKSLQRKKTATGKAGGKIPQVFKTKKKASGKKSARVGATHQQLNPRFRAMGRQIAALPTGQAIDLNVPDVTEHKLGMFKKMLKKWETENGLDSDWFEKEYRLAWKNMDEAVPTSAVREIVFGIIEEHASNALSQTKIDEIDAIFDAVSRVRLPTKIVGYASTKEKMQHPTAKGTEYFVNAADKKPNVQSPMSLHSFHDNARKNEIEAAMQAELKKSGATIASVMTEAIRAASAYTLNEMAAPVLARDVQPFSLMASVKDPILIPSLAERESMKTILVSTGGTQDPEPPRAAKLSPLTNAQKRGRDWFPRQEQDPHPRTASPPRPLEEDDDEEETKKKKKGKKNPMGSVFKMKKKGTASATQPSV